MGQRLPVPFITFQDSTGAPYAGGSLEFYATGSSTPQSVYTDAALTAGAATTLTLNSAGRPSVAVFLQNLPYKVVLKDSAGTEIWTADPVSGTDFLSVVITKVGSGAPTGVVAGTAGSSGVLPTQYWDYTNSILYICTTTGSASTAVWTAINASASDAVVTPPQGYLTPTSGTPIIATDSSAAAAVYYTPFVGNQVPIYNGSRFVPTAFSELTLTLVSQHALSTIYDVFVFSNSGVLTLVTGPAWSNSGAGTGSRGTGAGTTQIERLAGYWVNSVAMTGRNGSSTYSVGAQLATYLGSILIDGTAGQVSCHTSFGQSRKWGIWNAYNRQELELIVGDATASWVYNTNTLRQSNGSANNKGQALCGLPEERIKCAFTQRLQVAATAAGTARGKIAIGVNATAVSGRAGWAATVSANVGTVQLNNGTVASVPSGCAYGAATVNGSSHSVPFNDTQTLSTVALGGAGTSTFGSNTSEMDARAEHDVLPAIGLQEIFCLEHTPNTIGTGVTYYGGSDMMQLTARWRG